jgi:hypothetical protein
MFCMEFHCDDCMIKDNNELSDIIDLINKNEYRFHVFAPTITQIGFTPNFKFDSNESTLFTFLI